MRAVCLAFSVLGLTVAACSPAATEGGAAGGGGGGGAGGAGAGGPRDGGAGVGPRDGEAPDGRTGCPAQCPMGQVCVDGTCVPDRPCPADGGGCEDDSRCVQGRCAPFPDGGSDPACRQVVPIGLLSPQIHCEWLEPPAGDPFPMHKQVLTTPVVADFDFDDHRDPDNPTTKPSIVFATYDGLDGACGVGPMGDGANFGVIRVIDGRTCQPQYTIATHVVGSGNVALGDLDGDRRADLVTLSAEGGAVAFRHDRTLDTWVELWRSRDAAGMPSNPVAGICMWSGVALHDLDDDGLPEVLVEGFVYSSQGVLIDDSVGLLHTSGVGDFPIVADVDADGAPDLVTTRGRFRWSAAQRRFEPAATWDVARFLAVADFGSFGATPAADDRTRLDGQAEIAVVGGGQALIMTHGGRVVFGPIALSGSMGGGPPTIADFDGDGRAELAAAGSDSYAVFDPDCAAGGDAAHCGTGRTDGVLWTSVSQDHSSNITGSSIFDFEGDGKAEAVYADECFVRIYEGQTGDVLFSQQHTSCTWFENPVVADVAGNFRSKLLVSSNQNCSVSCPMVDPSFAGLRCTGPADCPGGLPCDQGLCRCSADADCGGTDLGCRPPPPGTPGTGDTCRALHTGNRTGVRVFGDILDRWVSSRALWNQHPYSVTNVLDDGTLPRTSMWMRNWSTPGLNNYRMNVQGQARPEASPDATGRGPDQCPTDGRLRVTVCNRGTAPVGDGVPVRFSLGSQIVCTGNTMTALAPGRCEEVTCAFSGATPEGEITVTVDPEGSTRECREQNNVARFRVICTG